MALRPYSTAISGVEPRMAAATASFHFSHLVRSGLIESRRQGRQIIYSANFEEMDALIAFLTHNCCQGKNCASTADTTEISPLKEPQ